MSLKAIAPRLRELVAISIRTGSDLERWTQQAQEFKRFVDSEHPDAWDALPHGLHHYLADADIRLKDSAYAEVQNTQAMDLVRALERGEVIEWPS